MATIHTNGTIMSGLIDPEVLAAMIDRKLVDAMKFAPLATVDTTLAGRPGDTITLPNWEYIGDAEAVVEGGAIPIKKLTKNTTSVKVSKIGIGTELTDEAMLSGYGDPVGECAKQIVLSIANGVDNAVLGIAEGITNAMTYTKTANIATDVNNALELFGEDIDDGAKVLLVSPADYTKLRTATDWLPASEISAAMIVKGAVGEIYGCQVVVTNKLKNKSEAFIIKPGALRLFLKRDTLVETDRDIYNKWTGITADKHFAAYLYDARKAIKIGTPTSSDTGATG